MTAYAHTREGSPSSSWEPLSVQLDKVSQSAVNFAAAFGARLWGMSWGVYHAMIRKATRPLNGETAAHS